MFGIAALAVLRTHLRREARSAVPQSAHWREFLQQNWADQAWLWWQQKVPPDVGLGECYNMPVMPLLLGLCLHYSLACSPEPHGSPSHFTHTLPQMSLLQECPPGHPTSPCLIFSLAHYGTIREKKKSDFYPSRFCNKRQINKRKTNRSLLTCISHIYRRNSRKRNSKRWFRIWA